MNLKITLKQSFVRLDGFSLTFKLSVAFRNGDEFQPTFAGKKSLNSTAVHNNET